MNWQLLIVGMVVLGAALFLGRRVLTKLQAFFGSKPVESSCGSCGGCSGGKRNLEMTYLNGPDSTLHAHDTGNATCSLTK